MGGSRPQPAPGPGGLRELPPTVSAYVSSIDPYTAERAIILLPQIGFLAGHFVAPCGSLAKLPPVVERLVARQTTARALGREYWHARETVRRHLQRTGVTLHPLCALTAEQKAQAVEPYEQGLSTLVIGKRTGVAATTVVSALERAGISRRQGGGAGWTFRRGDLGSGVVPVPRPGLSRRT